MITAGKDEGQTGIVSKVHRDSKEPGVIVKGMNLVPVQAELFCALLTMCTGLCPLAESALLAAVQKAHQKDARAAWWHC